MFNNTFNSYKPVYQQTSSDVHYPWNSNNYAVYWNNNDIEIVHIDETEGEPSESSVYTILSAHPGAGFTLVDLSISSSSKWIVFTYYDDSTPSSCYCKFYEKTSTNVWTVHSTIPFTVTLPSDYPRFTAIPGGYLTSSSDETIFTASSFTDSEVIERSGAVFVFEYSSPTWTMVQKIVNNGDTPHYVENPTLLPYYYIGSKFGSSVVMNSNGSKIIISAPVRKKTYVEQGEVKVYEKSGATWTLTQTIDAPDPFLGSKFGHPKLSANSDLTKLFICQQESLIDGVKLYQFTFSTSYLMTHLIFAGMNVSVLSSITYNDFDKNEINVSSDGNDVYVNNSYHSKFIKKIEWNGVGYDVKNIVSTPLPFNPQHLIDWVSPSGKFISTWDDSVPDYSLGQVFLY